MQHYGDHVELVINNASFQIPVHAYTPATHIEVGARQRHCTTHTTSGSPHAALALRAMAPAEPQPQLLGQASSAHVAERALACVRACRRWRARWTLALCPSRRWRPSRWSSGTRAMSRWVVRGTCTCSIPRAPGVPACLPRRACMHACMGASPSSCCCSSCSQRALCIERPAMQAGGSIHTHAAARPLRMTALGRPRARRVARQPHSCARAHVPNPSAPAPACPTCMCRSA